MSINNLSVVFFGNEQLSTGVTEPANPSLKALIDQNYDIKAVVLSKKGKSEDFAVYNLAKKHGIPAILTANIADEIHNLREFKADIGVLAAFGQMLPKELLKAFPLGIINIHPSLLPKYRGPTPIEQAILDGLDKTGVSIIKLGAKMDAGDIYAQTQIDIPAFINSGDLAELLAKTGADLLLESLNAIANQTAKLTPQDESQATYCRLITKKNGEIDWGKSATNLEREIRAYSKWPGSFTKLGGRDVIITAARLNQSQGTPGKTFMSQNGELGIYCGKDSLIINTIKPAGKNEMSGPDFARGYLR